MKSKLRISVIVLLYLVSLPLSAEVPDSCIRIRFLGTGAADWKGPDKRGEHRRLSSILVENSVLIDFTESDKDMLPDGVRPDVILYTHSHRDHYDPMAALEVGVHRVYVSGSWIERARADFDRAAMALGVDPPVLVPLETQQTVVEKGLSFKALPANHCTGDMQEQALIYLVEKNGTRVLYATDTGGLMASATSGACIDAYGGERRPIHGLIMEATMSEDEDPRLFAHSSVATVLRTYHVLLKTGCYSVPEDRDAVGRSYVYLTHLSRTLHGTQAELDVSLPEPLKAAYDGLEVVFIRMDK